MMRRRFPFSLGLVALLGCLAATPNVGQSQPPPAKINRELCIQDLPRAVLFPPIPVGCESIDCCPGCPARETINWRIRLGGEAVESMVLEFEGLATGSAARPTIEGEGRWVDERRLEIRPGVTLVRGLPRARGERAPVALPRIGRVRAGAELASDAAGLFEFSVEQFVSAILVSEFRIRYRLINCRPPGAQDIIRLDNNVSNDNAFVLLDVRRSTGCSDDERFHGTGSIPIGNALSNGTCRSEAVVFSNHNAMQLLPNVTAWTDAVGDLLPVPLTPLLQAPVAIWVLRSPYSTTSGSGYGDMAKDNVDRANFLYGTLNCGVVLKAGFTDATGNPNAPGLLTRKCGQAASLRTQIGFTPGALNVYYISDVQRDDTGASVRGATCGLVLATTPGQPPPSPDDWNTILISTLYADAESMAHEVGHAFSLAHTNTNPGISTTNLMNGATLGRNSLTEGQCFRVNVNPGSALNVNGVRTGPTRSCPDATTSSECPDLSLGD